MTPQPIRRGAPREERYGTFASYRDIGKVATPEHRQVLDDIRQLYSEEVTACFLAPLYPDHSRNNVWVLKAGV